MSEPHEIRKSMSIKRLVEIAQMEAISACSALNMDPEPLVQPKHEGATFLCDTDKWCAHAREHAIQAARAMGMIRDKRSRLRTKLIRLSIRRHSHANMGVFRNGREEP